jgi:molybdopterin synthase catalytic subunit
MFEARVQPQPFDLAAEHARLARLGPGIGAVVSFTGQVRDVPLEIEHFPAMAARQLPALVAEARRRWPLSGAILIHRHGLLQPMDPIVLVLTAAAHRGPAFEAAVFLTDILKTRAPFWKKGPEGWVEAHARDDATARAWDGA